MPPTSLPPLSFSSTHFLHHPLTCTFGVGVNIFNHDAFFKLLLSLISVLHSARLEKLLSFLGFDISVGASGTSWKLLELIPVIDDLLAAGPAFLGVVKDGFAGMVMTGGFVVLVVSVLLPAAVSLALLHANKY